MPPLPEPLEVELKLMVPAVRLPLMKISPLPCPSALVLMLKLAAAEFVKGALFFRVTLPVFVSVTLPPDDSPENTTAPVLLSEMTPLADPLRDLAAMLGMAMLPMDPPADKLTELALRLATEVEPPPLILPAAESVIAEALPTVPLIVMFPLLFMVVIAIFPEVLMEPGTVKSPAAVSSNEPSLVSCPFTTRTGEG
jgi:hypothetical protein